MVCPRCGQSNGEAAAYCTACGQSLTTLEVGATPSVPPPATGAVSGVPFQAPRTRSEEANDLQESLPAPSALTTPEPPFVSRPAAPVAPYTGAPPGTYIPVGPPAVSVMPQGYYAAPCRVCGNGMYVQQARCLICGTPAGQIADAADSTASRFVAPYGRTAPIEEVPSDVARLRWNWGAFAANGLWLCAHGMAGYGLLFCLIGLLPGLNLLLLFVVPGLGHAGFRLAWKRRHFDTLEQFLKTERLWLGVGLLLLPLELFWLSVTTAWVWNILSGGG